MHLKYFIYLYILSSATSINWDEIFQTPQILPNTTPESEYEKPDNLELLKPLLDPNMTSNLTPEVEVKQDEQFKEMMINKFLEHERVQGSSEELKKFSYQSYEESMEQKVTFVNPGIKMVLSRDALKNLVLGYVPLLLKMMLDGPLDLKYSVANLEMNQILVVINSMDISQINFQIDEKKNKLIILFPETVLTLYVTTILNLILPIKGCVTTKLNLKNFRIGLQFYRERHENFFKPRVLFSMGQISVEKSVEDLTAAFENIPQFLIDPILFIFDDLIKSCLQMYIHESFVHKGSLILNYLIDKKYPGVADIFKNNLRVSTLMTREPLITQKGLIFSMAGDIFNALQYKPEEYTPVMTNNSTMDPEADEVFNTQALLSASFVKKTIATFLSQFLGNLNVLGYSHYKLKILEENISLDSNGITLDKLEVHFYTQKPEIDQFGQIEDSPNFKELSGSLLINYIDLNAGKISISITDLKAVNWGQSMISSLAQMSVNGLLHFLTKLFADGEYDIAQVDFEECFGVESIDIVYKEDFLLLRTNLTFEDKDDEPNQNAKQFLLI